MPPAGDLGFNISYSTATQSYFLTDREFQFGKVKKKVPEMDSGDGFI
jgi:hypothetical protein